METRVKADVQAAYKQVFPMILAKCTRILNDPDEAHDVARETFTRLWAKRRSIQDPQLLTAWLYRTGTRLAIDRLRLRSRQQPTDEIEGVRPLANSAEIEDQTAARLAIHHLCNRTPTAELEAAILSGVDGLTHPEIGEVMGKSERTVRRLLARFHERRSKALGRS